jgi:putative membrane protein
MSEASPDQQKPGDGPRRPVLFEIDAPAARIDHEWEEFVKRPAAREPLFGTATLLAGGLFILILGFFVVESVGWVAALVETRPWLGWPAGAVLAIGVGLIIWAVWRELSALFAVRRMEDWQAALSEAADDMSAARAAANGYIALVRAQGLPIGDAREIVRGANSVEQIRNGLEATILPILDANAARITRAAAAQAFGLTAVSPSASIDAMLFSIRGIRLVRQVARAYGLRPHGLATWALLRRVMTNASLVAAVDIAGGMLGHAILTNPFAQKIAGEVAGATVASQRMYRLGRVASISCRLLPRRSGKED